MFYPMKFRPIYKNYFWGGRSFEKLGRQLPAGVVAESWEVSCRPEGMSILSNGKFEGIPLVELFKDYSMQIKGYKFNEDEAADFPLLIKYIDAKDNLSVQVHPDDYYVQTHKSEKYGKNEMWYIISAIPGSRLIHGVLPGITREDLALAISQGRVESCLKKIEVSAGDIIYVPSGLVHAIGSGIMLAEIQQNSDTTYRVFDFNRTDAENNKRPLHIERALEVIDYNNHNIKEKYRGLDIRLSNDSFKTILIANDCFVVEKYDISDKIKEKTDGSRFYIYLFLQGNGIIADESGFTAVKEGESVLIPAALGEYTIEGNLQALKTYVPDIRHDVLQPLRSSGYSDDEIFSEIGGLRY